MNEKMAKDKLYGKTLRKNFARYEEVVPMPNLLEIQKKSYKEFLDSGLREVRLGVNRLRPDSFRTSGVRDLDECIDTVAVQLIAVVPESQEIQRAAAQGTALTPNCTAYRALDALAARLDGQLIPLVVR